MNIDKSTYMIGYLEAIIDVVQVLIDFQHEETSKEADQVLNEVFNAVIKLRKEKEGNVKDTATRI